MVPVAQDENLPPVLDALHAAVSRLVDDRKEQVQDRILVRPSLYADLVDAVTPRAASEDSRCGAASTKMPVWAEPMELLWDIDREAKRWWREGTDTPDRLRSLLTARYRPQDSGRLNQIAVRVEEFCVSIALLLEPPVVKEVCASCPECGSRYVYKFSGGEKVRTAALTISAGKCVCASCHVVWTEDQFLFLATRLLGRPAPEGVLA